MSTPAYQQNEYMRKRAVIFEQLKEVLADAERSGTALRAEQKQKCDQMETEMSELKDMADRQHRAGEYERELIKVVRNAPEFTEVAGSKRSGLLDSAEYREAFISYMTTGSTKELRTLNATTSTDGAVFVPTDLLRKIVEYQTTANVVRGLATVVPASARFTLPCERASATVHAIPTVSGVDESGSYGFSQSRTVEVVFDEHKLGRITKVTDELLRLSGIPALDQWVFKKLGQGAGIEQERLCIAGNGTTDPEGLLTALTAGFTGAAISYDNVTDLMMSVDAPYRNARGAAFMGSNTAISAMMKLKDGDQLPIWQPSVVAGEPDKWRNRPVYESAAMPAHSNGNDVLIFGDISQAYMIAEFGNAELLRLNELYAGTGEVGFRFTQFWDGNVVDTRAAKKYTRSS